MSKLKSKDYMVEKVLDFKDYKREDYEDIALHKTNLAKLVQKGSLSNKKSKSMYCELNMRSNILLYCEKCGNTHNNVTEKIEIRKYEDFRDIYLNKIICNECGASYNEDEIQVVPAFNPYGPDISFLVYDKIYKDDNLVKLSIKIGMIHVYEKFKFNYLKYKVIFNTKTGQTYLYNAPENKKIKTKERAIPVDSILTNVNYDISMFDYALERCEIKNHNKSEYLLNIKKDLYEALYEGISNSLGYNPTRLEDYAKEVNQTDEEEIYSMKILTLYNRFPNINPFVLDYTKRYYGEFCTKNFEGIIVNIKNTDKDIASKLFGNQNEENKKELLNLMVKYPKSLNSLIFFSRIFRNLEYIESMLKTDMRNDKFFISNDYIKDILKKKKTKHNSSFNMLKDFVDSKGEEKAYSFIQRVSNQFNSEDMIRDISEIYFYSTNLLDNFNKDKFFEFLLNTELKKDDFKFQYNEKYVKKAFYCAKKLILEEINKKRSESKYQFKTLEEYYEEYKKLDFYEEYNGRLNFMIICSYEFKIISLYRYSPYFNPYVLNYMLKHMYEETEKIPKVIKSINGKNIDVLGYIFNYYQIPNVKGLKKSIMKNPDMFTSLLYYSIFFKDVNILNTIVKDKCYILTDYSYLSEYNMVKYAEGKIKGIKNTSEVENEKNESLYNFLTLLSKKNGEIIAGRKVINCYKDNEEINLKDIVNMFIEYNRAFNEELDVRGSIRNIHDRLVHLLGIDSYVNLTKKDFKGYKYTDEEKSLIYKENGYSFSLAKNGKELHSVGSKLNNCVSTYREKVRRKECLIVLVKYNNEYKVCIELLYNQKECQFNENKIKAPYFLNQAKLNYNRGVYNNEEILEIVLNWMKKNNIETNSKDVKLPLENAI